jgi:hypothetical protein
MKKKLLFVPAIIVVALAVWFVTSDFAVTLTLAVILFGAYYLLRREMEEEDK